MKYLAKETELLYLKSVFSAQIAEVNKLKKLWVKALLAGLKKCCGQMNFKLIGTLVDMILPSILLEDEQLFILQKAVFKLQ
jgi:hypothetical protein